MLGDDSTWSWVSFLHSLPLSFPSSFPPWLELDSDNGSWFNFFLKLLGVFFQLNGPLGATDGRTYHHSFSLLPLAVLPPFPLSAWCAGSHTGYFSRCPPPWNWRAMGGKGEDRTLASNPHSRHPSEEEVYQPQSHSPALLNVPEPVHPVLGPETHRTKAWICSDLRPQLILVLCTRTYKGAEGRVPLSSHSVYLPP